MNAFALSGFLTGVSSLAFGFLVYFRERGRTLNQLWCIFTVSVALWGFGGMWVALVMTREAALLAWRVSFSCGVLWIPILFYHFVSVFCDIRRRRFLILNYALGVIFFPLIYTDLFYPSVRYVFSSFYYSTPGPILYLFVPWWIGLVAYSHWEMLRVYHSVGAQKQLQIKYFFLATFIGYTGGSLDYLPIFGIDLYPWGNFAIVLYPIIMTYAIARYRLMDVTLVLNKGLAYLTILVLIAIPTSLAILMTRRATPYSTPPLLAATFVFSCGLWIAAKNPRRLPNLTFGLICLAVSDWLFGLFMGYSTSDPQEALFWMKLIYVGVLFVPPLFFHFVESFLERKTRPEWFYLTYSMSALFLLFLPTDYFISGLYHYPWGYHAKAGALHTVFLVYFVAVSGISLKRLYDGYWIAKERDPVQAIRIKYVFWAFVVGYCASIDFAQVYGFGFYPTGYLFVILWTVIVTYAIAKYRVMDVSVIFGRTKLIPAVQAIGLVALYFVILGLIRLLAGAMLYSLAGLLLAVFVLVAGALHAARQRVEDVILRTLWKGTYEAYERLDRMSQTLITLLDPNELTYQIVLSLSEAFSLGGGSLYLQDEKGNYLLSSAVPSVTVGETLIRAEDDRAFFSWLEQRHEAVELEELAHASRYDRVLPGAERYFARVDAVVCLPLVHNRRLIGIINLSQKPGKAGYTQTDIEVLDRFSAKASVALSNALVYRGAEQISQELQFMVEQRTEELADSKKELERSYRKLQELDQLKSQFLANTSHELRTPLTLILAPLQSILDHSVITGEERRQLDMIYQNGLRLLRLINNLLDFAKIDAEKMELAYARVDFGRFAGGIVASVVPLAEKKQITLKLAPSDKPIFLYMDADKIEKVLLNLIFNAIKFTPSGGTVTVSFRAEERDLRVSIEDTGIGIAKEDLPRLFSRFSQVDASSSRRYEGTGLGLALVKDFVELHRGKIQVDSEPGKGTNMSFTIPILEEWPGGGEEKEMTSKDEMDWTRSLQRSAEYSSYGILKESPTPSASTFVEERGSTILLVEDNPDMREFLSSQLQDSHRVIAAQDGVEGLARARAERPALIVSDVMMPRMDGYQLCRELKKDPATMQIPVILLTAKAELSMKIEGLESGADDYLSKPFSSEELRARIKSLLTLREMEAQLLQSEKMASLGMLAAGVAHEVNNPVNFARSNLGNLRRAIEEIYVKLKRGATLETDAELRELLEEVPDDAQIVNSGLDRIARIVQDMRVFIRKESETLTPTDLHQGIDSTLTLIRSELGHRAEIIKDYGDIGLVDVIAGQMNQVFMNLIQNAVHAIPHDRPGEIRVRTRRENGNVRISILDNGEGIPQKNLRRIFDPFFTTKEVGKGTGLGLWICDRIVRKHGGMIEVQSRANVGTEMTIVIPDRQAG